jgi:hypothetical protein
MLLPGRQAERNQEKKTQAVLGNDVGLPDELAAILRQSHEYDTGSQALSMGRRGSGAVL